MARRQKPPIAAWIQRERKRLGLSTKQLSERLALVGAKVGEQTISVWESYERIMVARHGAHVIPEVVPAVWQRRAKRPQSIHTPVARSYRHGPGGRVGHRYGLPGMQTERVIGARAHMGLSGWFVCAMWGSW